MNEVKSSLKRLYSRSLMLTAAVVSGGIAIAQAQKDHGDTAMSQPTISAAAVAQARPIPRPAAEANDQPVADTGSAGVATAAAEVPLDDSQPERFDSDDSAWSATAADADLSGDVHDHAYDAGGEETEYREPPPMLPDPLAAARDAESAAPVERTNPYRSGAKSRGSIYSSPADSDPGDAVVRAPDNEFALPDLDQTVAPAAVDPLGEADSSSGPPQLDVDEPPAEEFSPLPTGPQYEVAPAARRNLADPVSDGSVGQDAQPDDLVDPDEPAGAAPQEFDDHHSGSTAAPTANRYSEPQPAALPQGLPAAAVHAPPASQPAAIYGRGAGGDAPPSGRAVHSGLSHQAPYDAENVSPASGTDRDLQAVGKPGPQSMEGLQTPSLSVQKVAPQEVQVGQQATFQIRVRNVGRITAENVVIRDEVPTGTNFLDAAPKASRAEDGALFWEVGALAPGQDVAVSMQVMPVTEGQIGSVATVSFQASASARTRATKPDLVLEQTGPTQVLLGEAVRFSIKLSNPGTGAATQVILEEQVPKGLTHSSGGQLEYEVGTIEPGQTRHLELTLKADQAGKVLNTIAARADGGLQVEDTVEVEVVAPQLQVAIEGPRRRYLERQATFTVSVANPGTAAARNVELVAQLPTGLKFVSTNNSGYYDQSRHAVIWSLEQLPAGEMGKAQFTAVPVEMGAFQVHAEGRAESGLEARKVHELAVEGIAALLFSLADRVDPVEVGGQTSYEIKVINQGSKPATNVQFIALVPEGMQPAGAQGPTQEIIEGQRVSFAPLERLAPQEQAIYRVNVVGQAAGDHRFRVQMTSDETSAPVLKEESTRVYSD